MALEIHTRTDAGTVRLALVGELDTSTAPELDAAIDAAVTPDLRNLVVDLAKLEFVSSAGLRVFAKAQKTMKAQDGRSFFVHPTDQVRRVFEFVQAVKLSDVFESEADLDSHLVMIQSPPGS
jgi:anti-anti-sigma factor